MTMDNIKFITIHCSATENKPSIKGEDIKRMHTNRGWSDIGYHFVIETSGNLYLGRPMRRMGAHVKHHNANNIGICLIGGVDKNGTPVNNYTVEQMDTLVVLVKALQHAHEIPVGNIKGHREWFGDTNNDGVIDSRDWLKECPCFEVEQIRQGL